MKGELNLFTREDVELFVMITGKMKMPKDLSDLQNAILGSLVVQLYKATEIPQMLVVTIDTALGQEQGKSCVTT